MKIISKLSRRKFIKNVGITTLASQIPLGYLHADYKENKFTLEDITSQIINQVKKLSKGKKIKLSILQPKGSLGNVKPLGDLFQKLSGVNVNYIEASLDEINAKILAQSLSNQSEYDIALPATFGLPDLVESNAIRKLDEYVEKYEPDDFKKGMLYSIGDNYKGSFYGYQTDGDTYLMFYNSAMLNNKKEQVNFKKEYGYELKIPETWEQLDHMIQFFHRPTDNQYGGALYRNKDYIAWEWWSRFHAKGFYPFDKNLKPQINNNAGIEALEELIITSNYLYPQARTNGFFENREAFSEGNIFCNIGWGGTQKFLNGPQSKIKGNLDLSPLPGGYINNKILRAPYFNWGWNYTVSSSSDEPELAYLFTLFACSPDMSTLAVQFPDGYFDPFRVEHYNDNKIQDTYSKPFLDAHRLSMQGSIPDLYLTGQGEYWDELKDNLSLAEQGKLTPKVALDATAKVWIQINRHYGVKNQLEQWEYLKTLYPASIRHRLI